MRTVVLSKPLRVSSHQAKTNAKTALLRNRYDCFHGELDTEKCVAEQAPVLVYPWTLHSEDLKEPSFLWYFIGLHSIYIAPQSWQHVFTLPLQLMIIIHNRSWLHTVWTILIITIQGQPPIFSEYSHWRWFYF